MVEQAFLEEGLGEKLDIPDGQDEGVKDVVSSRIWTSRCVLPWCLSHAKFPGRRNVGIRDSRFWNA